MNASLENSKIISTIVRLLIVTILAFPVTADPDWRLGSVREQQVAQRLYDWQQRGALAMNFCWRGVKVSEHERYARPESGLIAAHSDISDAQLRADVIRQQMWCLLQQHPRLRAAAVERLRRHLPNLPVSAPYGAGSVSASYSEVLAAEMAYDWLRAEQGGTTADAAWTHWQQGPRAGLYQVPRRDTGVIARNLHQQLATPLLQLARR